MQTPQNSAKIRSVTHGELDSDATCAGSVTQTDCRKFVAAQAQLQRQVAGGWGQRFVLYAHYVLDVVLLYRCGQSRFR